MKARLFCPVGKLAGKTTEFEDEVLVGRKSTSPNSFVLSDSRVSTEHARIQRERGCYFLEDLGSTNGTTLAGVLLESRRRLENLDVINFGGVGDFVFQMIGEESIPTAKLEPSADTVPEGESGTRVESGAAPLPQFDRNPDAPSPEGGATMMEKGAPPLPPKLGKDDRPKKDGS